MAEKRPTSAQIRARRRNIIAGTADAEMPLRQAAKKFGVTPRQLAAFMETDSPTLRRKYNSSPVVRKLYAAGEKGQVRDTLELRHYPRRYAYEPQRLEEYVGRPDVSSAYLKKRRQAGLRIQPLYMQPTGASAWAQYAYRYSLPTDPRVLKVLYRNGRISSARYQEAEKIWRNNYPIPTTAANAIWSK